MPKVILTVTASNPQCSWAVRDDLTVEVTNVAFGPAEPFILMGEPFDSYDAAMHAIAEDILDNVTGLPR